jgi:hypothetical protein
LRDALIRRLAAKGGQGKEAFEAIRQSSASMIKVMAERLRSLHPDAGAVRLATPTSWGEMVFAFGYVLQQGGSELEDYLQGSGIQSALMLETLLLLDQDRSGPRRGSLEGTEAGMLVVRRGARHARGTVCPSASGAGKGSGSWRSGPRPRTG